MRPGPGLVVMALAFISGARRGFGLQNINPSQEGGKLGKSDNDDIGTLARVNPWLSACDLAQPNTAPDLQGQCSAGTLPVAWVDEGPGPPRCPPPCGSLKFQTNNNNNNNINLNNINKLKLNINNNLNININNNNKKMEETTTMFYEKQQCLDYLGDNEESSPAQICKKSSKSIETKLRSLRLRHCCERNAISALHKQSLINAINGGIECIRTINELLELDALAARITCEFTEILVRYDCRQPYSIIHHCEDCKEAYRRWVCSTLIPYFAEPEDIRHNISENNNLNNNNSSSNINNNKDNNNNLIKKSEISIGNSTKLQQKQDKTNDNKNNPSFNTIHKRATTAATTLKTPQTKPHHRIRKRIRPCLIVCQTVEKKCPYMLPGDRAPAHPTQYAGEPTFLCLDPNIPEVGEQLYKSNSGPANCCYEFCENPSDGLCSQCDFINNNNFNYNNLNNNTSVDDIIYHNNNINKYNNYNLKNNNNNNIGDEKILISNNLYNNQLEYDVINSKNNYYNDDDLAFTINTSNTCQSVQGTITSVQPSRCTIPYYTAGTTTATGSSMTQQSSMSSSSKDNSVIISTMVQSKTITTTPSTIITTGTGMVIAIPTTKTTISSSLSSTTASSSSFSASSSSTLLLPIKIKYKTILTQHHQQQNYNTKIISKIYQILTTNLLLNIIIIGWLIFYNYYIYLLFINNFIILWTKKLLYKIIKS